MLTHLERNNMRRTTGLAVVAFLLLGITGCTIRTQALLASTDRTVSTRDYDQGLRDHIASLEKGPKVEGSSCFWSAFMILPYPTQSAMERNSKDALMSAIDSAGHGYDAII